VGIKRITFHPDCRAARGAFRPLINKIVATNAGHAMAYS
jgi:hypothetical protein